MTVELYPILYNAGLLFAHNQYSKLNVSAQFFSVWYVGVEIFL